MVGTLTAGILAVTGMSLLLVPGKQSMLVEGMSLGEVLTLGLLFFSIAVVRAIPLSIPLPRFADSSIELFTLITTIGLTWLYVKAGYIFEGGILLFVCAANLMTLFAKTNGRNLKTELLLYILCALNIIDGLLMIFLPKVHQAYSIINEYRVLLGSGFVLCGLIGILLFGRNRAIRYVPVLPWVIWCVLFLISLSLSSLIPSAMVIAVALTGDTFPWERLALHKDDIVGHRIITVMSITLIVVIGVISSLLYVLEHTFTLLELQTLEPFRFAIFGVYLIVSVLMLYGVTTIVITVNSLSGDLTNPSASSTALGGAESIEFAWNKRITRFLGPLGLISSALQVQLRMQEGRIAMLLNQLSQQKRLNVQLTILSELSQQLEVQLEQPVAAQLVVNALEHAIECEVVCVYTHELEQAELVLMASAGQGASNIPWGYRQSITKGVLGRTIRQRKTQVVNNTASDPDFFTLKNEKNLSTVVVPLIYNGFIRGLLELTAAREDAFTSLDVSLAENIADELARSWARSDYYQRLKELIETGASLSIMISSQDTVRQIAVIARSILQARFVYVKIQPGQEKTYLYSASSGAAPRLLSVLEDSSENDPIIKMAFQASQPFRIRDISKHPTTSHLEVDQRNLKSLIVIPIRLHRLNVGTILAFGKQDEVFFTENDESLAGLIATQAAGAFESTWLQEELRNTLTTTSLLYQVSNRILQAQELKEAAYYIAHTAQKLSADSETGIVLFQTDGEIEAEVGVNASGVQTSPYHPMSLIEQAMREGKTIYVSQDEISAQVCIPIQTPLRKYGVLWVRIPDERNPKAGKTPDLQTLANQAALALERSVYLAESKRQAEELKIAYAELEKTYDHTLEALMSSLDARDRETEGHSMRVSQLATRLGRIVGLDERELKVLERGSLLHDLGKIGISDVILHKPDRLTEQEWSVMKQHPEIGARIVEGIPFLQETIPLIRHHQERWDGTGYPGGLSAHQIPLMARIFSIIDAFDALTTFRPYREKISAAEAIKYIRENAGALFDPEIVAIFSEMMHNEPELVQYDQ